MARQQYPHYQEQDMEAYLACIASTVQELATWRGALFSAENFRGCLGGFVEEKRKTLPLEDEFFARPHSIFLSQLDQTGT